ncbi:MAG: hypothetical protein ACPHJ3_01515, partial [Rubripirellula sp.]
YERSPLQLHLTTPAFPIDPGKAESSETNANQKNNSQAQNQNHNRTEPAGKKALPVSLHTYAPQNLSRLQTISRGTKLKS